MNLETLVAKSFDEGLGDRVVVFHHEDTHSPI